MKGSVRYQVQREFMGVEIYLAIEHAVFVFTTYSRFRFVRSSFKY
jgi:hypothetical protein